MNLIGIAAFVFAGAARPVLIPPPHNIQWHDGTHEASGRLTISLPAEYLDAAKQYRWLIDDVDLIERTSPSTKTRIPAQGYVLTITADAITIDAQDTAGVFNAMATLAQIIEQQNTEPLVLPCGTIRDWPDVPLRVVHIDLTCQPMQRAYVEHLMRTLARYKVNGILIEYSDMYPYPNHPGIARPDAYTPDDIAAIRRTAAACNQQLIPFQQGLGHLEYVLHKPAYREYGLAHNGYMLCPRDERTLPLVKSLIDDLLALHPEAKYLHIGGDEVQPVPKRGGRCERCAAFFEKHGFGALYADHYRPVAEYCLHRGITPLMWTDMIIEHPEPLETLPRGINWVLWDYGIVEDPTPGVYHGARLEHLDDVSPIYRKYFAQATGLDHAKQRGGFVAFGHAKAFMDLGFGAFAAPAARSSGDNFDFPRYDLHMKNIRMAFLKAADFNLPGTIVTSWSYRGSPHEVTLPIYACTAYGWNRHTADIETLMTQFFHERYGIDASGIVKDVLATLPMVPATTRIRPYYNDDWKAFVFTADHQLDQLRDLVHKPQRDYDYERGLYRQWAQDLDSLSKEVTDLNADRHDMELQMWRLSFQHLAHRLRVVEALAPIARAAYTDLAVPASEIEEQQTRLQALAPQRTALRTEWATLHRNTYTPAQLDVELYHRFDAETEMIRKVLADWQAQQPMTQPNSD